MTGALVLLATAAVRQARRRTSRRDTAMPSLAGRRGVTLQRTVTIEAPRWEVFRRWRSFEDFPAFVPALETVCVHDGVRSSWSLRTPGGRRVRWHAAITAERSGELLVWRSGPGSDLELGGSASFRPAPGGRGTEIRLTVTFDPPGGLLGDLAEWVSGTADREVREGLRRFKQMVEAFEIPTTQGQSSGRRAGSRPARAERRSAA